VRAARRSGAPVGGPAVSRAREEGTVIVLAGYAPDFMGREFIADGMTVGYALALTQFVMTWALGWMYLRRADRVFDPLAEKAAEVALRAGGRPSRFERGASPEGEEVTGR
jgi:hypothetical protein